jgi:hypothetical protein
MAIAGNSQGAEQGTVNTGFVEENPVRLRRTFRRGGSGQNAPDDQDGDAGGLARDHLPRLHSSSFTWWMGVTAGVRRELPYWR